MCHFLNYTNFVGIIQNTHKASYYKFLPTTNRKKRKSYMRFIYLVYRSCGNALYFVGTYMYIYNTSLIYPCYCL